MMLVDFLGEHEARNQIQVFGTDISEDSLSPEPGRNLSPASAMSKIPPDYFSAVFLERRARLSNQQTDS